MFKQQESHDWGIDEEILKRLWLSCEKISKIITSMNCDRYKDYVSDIIDKKKEKLIIQSVKENPESIKAYYMPIINNNTLIIEKYEALARLEIEWKTYEPSEFIDIISKNNLDNILANKILNDCISKLKDNPTINISLNLNCNNINDVSFLTRLFKLVKNKEIKKWALTVELLETISKWKLHDEKLKKLIKNLKNNWIYVSLDDLWSVNSDINRFIELKDVDLIKIDWWLVKWLSEENIKWETNESKIKRIEKTDKIITFIVQIANWQWQKVIAEYVSNEQIFEKIKKLWVDYSQWYYIWKPKKRLILES